MAASPILFSWGFFVGYNALLRDSSYGQLARFGAALAAGFALAVVGPARAQAPPPRTEPAASAREVTDEAGRRVSVPQPVRRIVSLAPSVTETLYALGAQDRLAGVTDYCDYPPEAQSKPKVGGVINPNLEEVVALKPDLVVAAKSINRRETVEALERLNIAAYATDPHTVMGMLESTARLAELIGARERGETLTADLRARLAELKQRLAGRSPKPVLFVVWYEPLISIGQNTFIADALRWAGAESVVVSRQDWPHMNLEEVVRLQPEYLVFAGAHADAAERDFDALREEPGWRSLEAVRERRIAVISDAVNRPAPRLIDAIEQLARILHPQVFAAKPEARNWKSEMQPAKQASAPEKECVCAR